MENKNDLKKQSFDSPNNSPKEQRRLNKVFMVYEIPQNAFIYETVIYK